MELLKDIGIFVVAMLLRIKSIKFSSKQTILFAAAMIVALAGNASLGLGKKRSSLGSKKILSAKVTGFNGNFSLKSGYSFRGSNIIETKIPRVIELNTEVTAKKGNLTLTIPLRKQVLVNSIKIGVGNESLRTH
ncbi:MAG: hypothetical protein EB025_00210 [Chitinophagaceae bacterium]|nr:hypothetical protein [Chitinophagaceae bacterium]NCW88214.1 hypothetical protein [Chitinophagia bacterium]NDB52483.1 hypothetical protein [Chitinophagaceae bacterium]NDE77858.1 hypothetical protein [Chitinophagaceae bacterium]HAL95637.1 hypothetical protein [Chitinophagaceae bacterium]